MKDVIEASISGRVGPSASQAARRAPWIAYFVGWEWDMKVVLAIPNVQFVAGSERSQPILQELESIGFRFHERVMSGGSLLSAKAPIEVELETAADLVELQRRIGLPIKLEDGVLEITS